MGKKTIYFRFVIIAVTCFFTVVSIPCMAEERYYQERTVSILNPEVPGPLESVDIRLEEMADQIDLEDASSVSSYISELELMKEILHRECFENTAETELEERIVRIPINIEGGADAYITSDGRGGVLWICGGDSYSKYYYLDKELIGLQTGHSDGRFDFASQLPKWKDDDTSMDVPLAGDEPKADYSERVISWEKARQDYADFVEEIFPDTGDGSCVRVPGVTPGR